MLSTMEYINGTYIIESFTLVQLCFTRVVSSNRVGGVCNKLGSKIHGNNFDNDNPDTN
jgi:hypothetical protein